MLPFQSSHPLQEIGENFSQAPGTPSAAHLARTGQRRRRHISPVPGNAFACTSRCSSRFRPFAVTAKKSDCSVPGTASSRCNQSINLSKEDP
jgi:hypothetical protein